MFPVIAESHYNGGLITHEFYDHSNPAYPVALPDVSFRVVKTTAEANGFDMWQQRKVLFKHYIIRDGEEI